MSALHESYLRCLNRLREEVKAAENDEVLEVLDILKIRLTENLETLRLQGDPDENKSKRYQILEQLNKITRELYYSSFDDYCESKSQPSPLIPFREKTPIPSTPSTPNIDEEIAVPSNTSALAQQTDAEDAVQPTIAFFLTVKTYITTLHMNVQKAQEVFNSDSISQEQCKEVLSSFSLFDCSNFPDYTPHLYRAKTRLQYFNHQVNRLRDFCEICDNVDRPSKASTKKIQEIIGILNPLRYDIEIFFRQFDAINMTTTQEL